MSTVDRIKYILGAALPVFACDGQRPVEWIGILIDHLRIGGKGFIMHKKDLDTVPACSAFIRFDGELESRTRG